MDIGQLKNGDIDEPLYSRQLYVHGHEAIKRMGVPCTDSRDERLKSGS
jgi:hypothetical protein